MVHNPGGDDCILGPGGTYPSYKSLQLPRQDMTLKPETEWGFAWPKWWMVVVLGVFSPTFLGAFWKSTENPIQPPVTGLEKYGRSSI